jgi:hypothetical protein
MMTDDLIDDSGFELGMPTHAEMLQHYNRVLEAELDMIRRDLRRAHQTIGGMIFMHGQISTELASPRIEHGRVSTSVARFYETDLERAISEMTYQYGEHTMGKP